MEQPYLIIYFLYCVLVVPVGILIYKIYFIKSANFNYLEFTSEKAKELRNDKELIKCLKNIKKSIEKGDDCYIPNKLSISTENKLKEMGYYVNRVYLFGKFESISIFLENPYKKRQEKD